MAWLEQNWRKGLKKFSKINNVVNVFNNLKDFCCLDLKCYVLFPNFLLDLYTFID